MNIRNSNEPVVPQVVKKYGIGNFKVVGVNCTLAELEALEFPYKKEPVYRVELEGKMYQKIVFYVQNVEHNVKNKVEFLIHKDTVYYSTGSKRFVNDLAQSSIGKSLEECLAREHNGATFFKNVNARPARQGEVELYEFLVAWFNLKNFVTPKERVAGLEPDRVDIDFERLLTGDVSELKQLVVIAKENEVKLLVHIVNDYMNIYARYFDRASANLTNFSKYLRQQEKQGYPVKGDYICADLCEYKGTPAAAKPDEEIPEADF